MKQEQSQNVNLYYTNWEQDVETRKVTQKVNESDEYETIEFKIPRNYVYSIDLEFLASEGTTNTVDIKKIKVSTLFSSQKFADEEPTEILVDGGSTRIELIDDVVFSYFQIGGKIKIIAYIIAWIVTLLFYRKINKFLFAEKQLNYNRFKVFYFAYFLIMIFFANLLMLDSETDKLMGNLEQKPELTSYKQLVDGSFMDDIENYFKDQFYYKNFLIEDYYAYNRLLQRNKFDTSTEQRYITKINGDNIIYRRTYGDQDDLDKNIGNVVKLNDLAKEKNIPYYFFMAPTKEIYADKNITDILDDNSSWVMDYFKSGLEENGVNVTDLSDILFKSAEEDNRLVHFRTDHHWTFESAFVGYKYIQNILNKDNVLDNEAIKVSSDFNFNSIRDISTGSEGRALAYGYRYNQKLEDLCIITPKGLGDYTVTDLDDNVKKSGDFLETMNLGILQENIEYEDRYPIYNPFGSNIKIINNNIDSDKEIVVIKDSFGLPLSSFLSQNFKQVTVLDMRNLDDGYIAKYIEENNPDVIINILYTRSIKQTRFFDYFD